MCVCLSVRQFKQIYETQVWGLQFLQNFISFSNEFLSANVFLCVCVCVCGCNSLDLPGFNPGAGNGIVTGAFIALHLMPCQQPISPKLCHHHQQHHCHHQLSQHSASVIVRMAKVANREAQRRGFRPSDMEICCLSQHISNNLYKTCTSMYVVVVVEIYKIMF